MAVVCHGLTAAEFYVATAGDDAHPGTQDRPFATLERARDAIRALRVTEPQATVRVVLSGGTYRLGQTIVFDLRDSAAGNAATEITAAPNERPILSGAAPLPGGWQPAPQELARLPEEARGRVWMAEVPTDWPAFRTLFQADTMLPRARTRGFRQLKAAPAGGQAIDLRHLCLPAEAVQSVADFSQAEMVVVPVYPWTMNILPMTEVDRATGLVRTAVPATYPLGPPNFANFPDGTVWIEQESPAPGARGASHLCRRLQSILQHRSTWLGPEAPRRPAPLRHRAAQPRRRPAVRRSGEGRLPARSRFPGPQARVPAD